MAELKSKSDPLDARPYRLHDRTHGQLDPEAYRLVVRNGGVIEPGQREDKTPKFRGLPDEWWQALYDNNPRDFFRLIVLCRRDFPTYAVLLGKIVSRLDKQRTPLIFNNGQKIVWNKKVQAIEDGRMPFLIILKARQFGVSSMGLMENFWAMWAKDDIQSVDVAHDEELAGHLIAFYSLFYDSLPKVVDSDGNPVRAMRPQLRSKAKNARVASDQLEFPDKNCIGIVVNAKKNEPRGMSATRINLREAAYYPNLIAFWEAIEPQLPSVGTSARLRCSVVFESSPNGENDFYDFWITAKDPESEMIPVFLPWFIHDDEYTAKPPPHWRMSTEDILLQTKLTLSRQSIDGRDVTREQMYWRSQKILNNKGGVDWFDREYPSDDQTCFLMKSESAFASDMKYMLKTVSEAELRSSKIPFRYVAPGGRIEEKYGPTTGNLDYKRAASPFKVGELNRIVRPNFIPGGSSLWVWEPPVKGHGYFVGADSAGGELNRDSSSAAVLDLRTGRQVAEYDGKMGPEDYADFLVHLCAWYNMAWIMPEINSHGATVMKRMVRDWHYPHIAKEEKWDQVSTRRDKNGFFTSPQTRPILLSNLKYMIENRYIEIASREFIREASQMKRMGDDYRTAKTKQADNRIFAMALCCIGIRQSPALFSGLHAAQQSRIPSAIDLGLSHSDSGPQHDEALRSKIGEEKFDKLFGNTFDELPWNPMRQGVGGMLDF